MVRVLILMLLLSAPGARAAVDIGVGNGASCFTIVAELQRNWLTIKRVLLPGTEELSRPDDANFVCVSPLVVRESMEKRTGMGSSIRCFRAVRAGNIGFCCDSDLGECAALNPALFPEAYQPKRSEEAYQPPQSDWVRPPAESEQWQSN